ncbi:MAG: DHHA1 domain-containing protein, partial [Proteiniphilum sp.]
LRYREVKQQKTNFYQIVLSRSPFYAEMGGQVGDSGWLTSEADEKIEIFDTKRENNLAVHLTHKLPENPEGTCTAKIDTEKRTATECNHSATHLMHEALREVLGTHVEQKGSYVSPELLRFDFSHFRKMTPKEIREVERRVTAAIRSNFAIEEQRHVPIEEAKAQGAMALFGEKYGDQVRTVRFGSSIELCGGTHISSTGRIGTFRIISESAISAGVRRIEAVTAKGCEEYLYAGEDAILEIRNLLNNVPDIVQGVHRLLSENEEMKKQVQQFMKEKSEHLKQYIIEKREEVNGISLFCAELPEGAPEMVKDIAFQLKSLYPVKMMFAAGTVANGKPSLTVMLSDDLVAGGLHAGNMVREAAKLIRGGGGGQPHFATAGGKDPDGLHAAVEAIVQKLKEAEMP